MGKRNGYVYNFITASAVMTLCRDRNVCIIIIIIINITMMMMMKLPILPCAEKLELVLSTAPRT